MMFSVLLCAIQLSGVTGDVSRVRAFFDENNVKVGDPLTLTIDFLGVADFGALHPPLLARAVDRRDWKVDDASARTETYRDARRLTYRVRPVRAGVLWFPALEFSHMTRAGEVRQVRSNEIPVHAKAGADVVVAEMGDDVSEMPRPPELVTEVSGLADDERFAWRKALAEPTADAFAAFDFPAARMNEATCAIRAGEWARAMGIYSRLEWTLGQTPEIERGLVAALALRYDNSAAELPVWRQVLRPVLRFGWKGRGGIVIGVLVALALLFWLLGRLTRALACCLFALALVSSASAENVFDRLEREMTEMRERMDRMTGNFSFHFGEKERQDPVRLSATVALSTNCLQVGENFAYVISLEAPANCSVGQVGIIPSETTGLRVVGEVENLPTLRAANSSNVVMRMSVPVRYDIPFEGEISFLVKGMTTVRQTSRGGRSSFSFSQNFACETRKIAVHVRPLPSAGQPADFSGIVSEGLRLHEYPNLLAVETNDVITIAYRLVTPGYVPPQFLPQSCAFEWMRDADRGEIEFRRFLVADGLACTPELSISYYDPRKRKYLSVKTGGTPLKYLSPRKE